MVKWISKFVLDILPSVAATIIGAYIVNHYIIPKSQTGAPAAAMATADPKADSAKSDSVVSDAKADKPVIEKASFEKTSFEKGVAEKAAIERTAEKAASEKPADITGATDRRHRPAKAAAEKPAAKPQPAATVAAIDPTPAPSADDRRDANELARAAIDRLRPQEQQPRPVAEPARTPDVARATASAQQSQPPSMQPLPPPIMVSTPNADVFNSGAGAAIASPTRASAERSDSSRLSPPGDIPRTTSASHPLDLHADSGSVPSGRTSVADDVMSAAKSMFHAVLPR